MVMTKEKFLPNVPTKLLSIVWRGLVVYFQHITTPNVCKKQSEKKGN